jgi:hypothetical protein
MEQLPAEEILDIYKKIIRELIGAWDLDEESTDSEPLPARVGWAAPNLRLPAPETARRSRSSSMAENFPKTATIRSRQVEIEKGITAAVPLFFLPGAEEKSLCHQWRAPNHCRMKEAPQSIENMRDTRNIRRINDLAAKLHCGLLVTVSKSMICL